MDDFGLATPTNNLAAVAAISDPVERYRAARAAGAAVAAEYSRIEVGAMLELAHAHAPVTGKNAGEPNAAAAARELGLTSMAVLKRIKGGDLAARPASTPAVQREPARRFGSADEAAAALDDWELRQEEVTDELESLLLGALAAGLDPLAIQRPGVSLERLRRIRPAGNIQVSQIGDYDEVVEDFARLVTAHAAALGEQATTGAGHSAARVWKHAAALIVTNAAPYALLPAPSVRREDFDTAEAYAEAVMAASPLPADEEPDPRRDEVADVNGPDAWLAKFTVQMGRQARRGVPDYLPPEGREHAEAVGRACGEIAAAVRHLRATGTLPVLEA